MWIDLDRSFPAISNSKRAAETREDHHQVITMHFYVEKEGGFRVVVHEYAGPLSLQRKR